MYTKDEKDKLLVIGGIAESYGKESVEGVLKHSYFIEHSLKAFDKLNSLRHGGARATGSAEYQLVLGELRKQEKEDNLSPYLRYLRKTVTEGNWIYR